MRREQRRRRLWRRATAQQASSDAASSAEGPGGVELQLLLDDLDPERRAAFVATQVLGLSYAEAPEVYQCPVGTIRSRVARARQDLVSRFEVDGAQAAGEPSARPLSRPSGPAVGPGGGAS